MCFKDMGIDFYIDQAAGLFVTPLSVSITFVILMASFASCSFGYT